MGTVSIVLCVYNGAAFLAQTLESVLAQTHDDWELIVVDDGSGDASAEIVRGFTDARIALVRQENRGAAAALATGLAAARGEFVALLDQDDLWHRDKLACHVERMRAAPEVALTFSWFTYVDQAGRSIGLRSRRCHGTFDFRSLLSDFAIGATSNIVIRRDAVARAGGVDSSFPRMYDLDLCLRTALLPAHTIEALPRDLLLYRRCPHQISRDFRSLVTEWERVLAKMRGLAPEDVAAVEGAARCSANRYFSRLAYEQAQFGQALRYMGDGFRAAPLGFLADRRNWLTTAACVSGAVLPPRLHAGLERAAGLRRP